MHACGHDAHSAALLGCALVLSKIDPGFRVRLIFQPGEEGYFGAVGMIDDGCLEGVDAIVGGHVGDLTEELKPGQFGFRSGVLLAAADRFEGVFIGKGCHGSAPHRGRDPIPALAEYILACHVARSREFDQSEQVVLSICAVSAGTTHNVIPERATFLGTARTLSPEDRVRAKERLAGIGEGIALATGTKFEFTWLPGYPPLCNHPEATKAVSAVAQRLFGPDRVVQIKKANMGGEDFAYYLQRVPGSFWFLNTNDPARGIDKPNHNARFDVDERYLWEMAWLNLSAAAELAFPSAGA
jgi:amidohydrolase